MPSEPAIPPLAPEANPRLLGQTAAERRLIAAAQSGRLPHGWVFAGPAGIGKATLAFRFARALLAGRIPAETEAGLFGASVAEPDLAVSPEDPVFRRVAARGHADLLVIEREPDAKTGKPRQSIPVDAVRKIGGFMRKTAGEGGWRIVIVDGAETLNREGQNALLKILEEPPDRALLILVTTQPGGLLPTIRSRVRLLPLEPLSDAILSQLLEDCGVELDPRERAAILDLAGGSIGRALDLIDRGGLELYQEITALMAKPDAIELAQIHRFSQSVGGSEERYALFAGLFRDWLGTHIRGLARSGAGAQLDPWLTLWEKATALLDRADAGNLDRRQTLVTLFSVVRASFA